jgi:hypothetical protein
MISVRQPTLIQVRRHHDPPFLWGTVVAGSLLLNGILTAGLQSYLQPMTPLPSPAPISVDFLPPNTPQVTAKNNLVSTTANRAPNSSSSTTVSGVAISTRKTPPIAQSASISLNHPKVSQSKVIKLTPKKTKIPSSAPPSPANASADTALAQEPVTASAASTRPEPLVPNQENTIATSGIRLPDVPQVPDPTTNPGTAAPKVATTLPITQTITPPKFLMQVKVLKLGNPQATNPIPDPKNLQLTKTFSSGEAGCTLTPAALRDFNQPIRFNLTLNKTGTVAEVLAAPLPDSIARKSYEDLAICTLKTWILDQSTLSTIHSQADVTQLAVQVILTRQ